MLRRTGLRCNTVGSNIRMVKSFRLAEVLTSCSNDDLVFARKMSAGSCQFFSWPGLSHSVAVQGILSMPAHLQTVHAVFGRQNVPVDICVDVDCKVPERIGTVEAVKRFQRSVLEDHLTGLHEAIKTEGEEIQTQVVLQSPNLKKASFHIHIKLKDAAFEDYRSLLGFLQSAKSIDANGKQKLPDLDLQIYRANGMLRMYKSKKENLQSPITLFEDRSVHIGFNGGKVTDVEAGVHSLCVREPKTFSRVIRKAFKSQFDMHANQGGATMGVTQTTSDGASTFRYTCPAPRTKVEACENAKMWLLATPAEMVHDWKGWIALGLAAFRVANHFQDAKVPSFRQPVMDEFKTAWIETSMKVPEKFVLGDCERAWGSFQPETRNDSWWVSYKTLCRFANGGRAPTRNSSKGQHAN